MSIPTDIKVGTYVWVQARYNRTAKTFEDVLHGWDRCEIIAETRVSWVVGYGYADGQTSEIFKINKKTGELNKIGRIRWTLDGLREEWEEQRWASTHAHRIGDAVRRSDAVTLRQVAELIGYKAEP